MSEARVRGWTEYFLSFGAYPGEPSTERGKRRIIIGYAWAGSFITLGPVVRDFVGGLPLVAAFNLLVVLVAIPGLFLIRARPHRFRAITNAVMATVFVSQLAVTALLGGLWPSSLTVLFGLVVVLAAAIGLGRRATALWFAAFIASLFYAAAVPNWIEATYVVDDPTARAVLNIAVTASLTLAVVLYFARQRDHFQRQSDELLHNILPNEIADRLKIDTTMIAEHFDEATVLFADVVDFTPMSAAMSPAELVGLLNSLFSVFDRFVEELGVEKIKTAGDEYMVAAGVPRSRPDHAQAAAELALRMRDHVVANPIAGRSIEIRIGIHSGPLVAGVIGTGRFSYDLWGDTVNTASRMESGGLVGSIQVSAATHKLIRNEYDLTPRGTVAIKGKGDMETFILVGSKKV